jgi:acetate---CoA ligase (ADP-forming)
LGFPVAVKVLHAALAHKTEVGGLQPGVASAAEAKAASVETRATVAWHDPTILIERFLVERWSAGQWPS